MIVAEAHQEVPGGLDGPTSGGVGRDPSEMHPTGADFDDEQDVEPAQEDGVDTGEVGW